VATVVAVVTRSVVWTVVAGLGSLWLLQLWL
jgi:branched-subunit amino acid transport protein